MESRAATVVLAQRVDPARQDEYERWQKGINGAASKFPGYEKAEVIRPTPGVQDEWVIVYRFDTHRHLEDWLGSPERAHWIERANELCFEPAVAHRVAAGGARDRTVTVVASHRVKPGAEGLYRRWQQTMDKAASRFPGFVSTELFEPVSGEQEDWVVVFRFEDAERLEGWLGSDERAELLRRAEPYLERVGFHKVGGGLGGWFPISDASGAPAVTPPWKQGMAVLAALYPTVVVLAVLTSAELATLPGSIAVFVSNVLSVAVLTWLLMPVTTRALARWLDPRATARTTALGAGVLFALYAAMVAGFWAAGV